jgi:hypothetical protein
MVVCCNLEPATKIFSHVLVQGTPKAVSTAFCLFSNNGSGSKNNVSQVCLHGSQSLCSEQAIEEINFKKSQPSLFNQGSHLF